MVCILYLNNMESNPHTKRIQTSFSAKGASVRYGVGVNPSLAIGLGNPGREYKMTYHNVGILFVDYLIDKMPPISNFKFLISNTFMNQSGGFVKKALKKYKIKPEELMIIHDDSDIELGKYKISFGRSSAGHKGVQSIIDVLGTKNFWRLRIGIRKALRKKAGEIVLQKINKNDLETLEWVFEEISNSFDKIPG
jgi:PTH1 family peptidyl-tRNA hydrolase